MARQKVNEDYIRKIQKSSGGYHVSIPMSLMRKYGWKEGQKVEVEEMSRKRIVIKDWKK